MPTSVALTPHFETLTQQWVANGRYNNVSEVIRDGLRLLESRVHEEEAKLIALREAANQGFAAIERGEFQNLRTELEIHTLVRQLGQEAKATVPKAA